VLIRLQKRKRSIVRPEEPLLDSSSPLLDAVIESYVTWREESAAVNETYRRWTHAVPNERAIAFGDYAAALDREEDAATEYRRLVEELGAAEARASR
jgi:hypothetical protein